MGNKLRSPETNHPSTLTSSLLGLCGSIITSPNFLLCSRRARGVITTAARGLFLLNMNTCRFWARFWVSWKPFLSVLVLHPHLSSMILSTFRQLWESARAIMMEILSPAYCVEYISASSQVSSQLSSLSQGHPEVTFVRPLQPPTSEPLNHDWWQCFVIEELNLVVLLSWCAHTQLRGFLVTSCPLSNSSLYTVYVCVCVCVQVCPLAVSLSKQKPQVWGVGTADAKFECVSVCVCEELHEIDALFQI